MWAPNVAALAADRLVITWDMRGHGESDAPEDQSEYSHTACVADMAALLDLVDAERAVIGGMSLGGFLSLSFHLRHPERVVGLLLVDTGPGYRADGAREQWNQWARGRADALEREGLSALPGSREQKEADHRYGVRGLAHAARGMLVQRNSDVFESLAGIRMPTLIVVGEEDHQFLAAADAMTQRIPGARKIVLAGAGHAANMDAPEPFNAAVREFLEGL
jgi:pimeloyl-ACP methyl ester carboxylesterase